MYFNLSIPSISIQIQIFSRCQALETELFFRISGEIPIKIGNCTVEENQSEVVNEKSFEFGIFV